LVGRPAEALPVEPRLTTTTIRCTTRKTTNFSTKTMTKTRITTTTTRNTNKIGRRRRSGNCRGYSGERSSSSDEDGAERKYFQSCKRVKEEPQKRTLDVEAAMEMERNESIFSKLYINECEGKKSWVGEKPQKQLDVELSKRRKNTR
jgi:hypothetical protein